LINRSPLDVLVLVPARKGSKRLPHKNRLQLGNASLLKRTVGVIKDIGLLENTIVSTDDDVLAREAIELGLPLPEMRPSHLAQDNSATIEVFRYVLSDLAKRYGWHPKFVLLLQLTSPFRDPKNIKLAIDTILEKKYIPAIVSGKISEIKSDKTIGCAKDYILKTDLDLKEELVDLDGNFYVGRVPKVLSGNSFSPTGTKVILSSEQESIDIDTLDDFKLAHDIWKSSYQEHRGKNDFF
tara:strand:- start:2710 stop:3426 length:717 start_codon:yes stop_codon:yes gene_type:complete